MSFGYGPRLLGGGDPEAQAAAQNSMAMQPNVLNHLQGVLSDLRSTPSYYDPSRSPRENALDPRGIEQATNVALSMGPGAIRAFHGSPYNFSRFDSSKIGTGEGAQVYGHGLYFAENEGVARAYRDKLATATPDKITPDADAIAKYSNQWDEIVEKARAARGPIGQSTDASLGFERQLDALHKQMV